MNLDTYVERVRALGRRVSASHAGRRPDLWIATTLAVVGGVMGAVLVDQAGQGQFYQQNFAPAVMQACGHEFTEYTDPTLAAFLALTDDRYACPDPYLESLRSGPTLFAEVHRYLLTSASVLWLISGISWAALLPLFALLYALASAGLYAVFRLLVSRTAAVAGALLLMTSPGYLGMLRELRDFSKVPFMVVGFFFVALFVKQRFTIRTLTALGAALGVTLGIGFGFRGDVLAIIPLFLAALVLFPAGGLRVDLRGRAAALAAFGVAFVIAAAPVLLDLRKSEGGGNATLMAVHGSTAPFNEGLGVEQDLYSAGYLYNDGYAVSLVNAHAYRIENFRERNVQLQTAELERYSQSYYMALARNFPADWVLRGRASVARVLELGAFSTTAAEPVPSEVDPLGVLSPLRNTLGDGLRGLGNPFLLPLLALFVGAILSLRGTLFALVSTVYLCVLSTVQFSIRHVFYLEVIWWLAAVFLLDRLVRAGLLLWRERDGLERLRPERRAASAGAIRVGVVALALVALSAGLLIPLRAYQDDHVETLLERYEQAERTELPTTAAATTKGHTLVRFAPGDDPAWKGPVGGILSALFVASFSRENCPFISVLPIARYEAKVPYLDWSTKLDVRLAQAGSPSRVNVYFLGFNSADNRLVGIELPSEQRACLKGVAAVETDDLPVLLNATLPDDWREVTRHATLARTESRRRVYEGAPLVVTSGISTPPLSDDDPQGELYRWDRPAYQAADVSFENDKWSYEGNVDTRFSYLVQTRPQKLPKGRFVVVHGFVDKGGLTIGLQRDNVWAAIVNVTAPGEFYAAIEAPEPGLFSLVVANNVANDGSRNDVRIESTRWNVPAVRTSESAGKKKS